MSDLRESDHEMQTETIVGRVMKRRVYSTFSVLELVSTSICGDGLSKPITVAAVFQATGDYDYHAFVRTNVRLGDVVQVAGAFNRPYIRAECKLVNQPASKLGFDVCSILLLEKWDASAYGELYYTAPVTRSASASTQVPAAPELNHAGMNAATLGVAGRMPHLILQCAAPFLSRLAQYVHERWGPEDVFALPSTTHFSTTSERHLLLYIVRHYEPSSAETMPSLSQTLMSSPEEEARVSALHDELLCDPNLTGVIKRCYRFDGPHAGASASFCA